MKRELLVIFLIAAISALAVLNLEKNATLKDKAQAAASRGSAWLLNYAGKFGDPGILWIFKEINDKYCNLPRINAFIALRWNEFQNNLPEQAYKKLLDRNYDQAVSDEVLKEKGARYDNILLPSLYCDVNPLPQEVKQEIFNIEGAAGYDLTHKFLAALFMKNNSCGESRETERLLLRMEEKIIQEQDISRFDDIFAERLAFLFYAGSKDKIKEEWIETVIKNQSASGSWRSGLFFGKREDPHATALSLWALSEYSSSCPFK